MREKRVGTHGYLRSRGGSDESAGRREMTMHSKGKYVAFRSGRDAPTRREIVARARIARLCKEYCDSPFADGCEVRYSLADYNREVTDRRPQLGADGVVSV
jgi:hypothetical protein